MRIKRSGLPRASTAVCTFVLSPPRDRPIACAFFLAAPTECWWARTMVLSRNTSSKSASSASSANTFCQMPLFDQRAKRMYTLFQSPNSVGRSRHGLPVRAIHSTASINCRLSSPLRPGSPVFPGNIDSKRCHWSLRRDLKLGVRPRMRPLLGCFGITGLGCIRRWPISSWCSSSKTDLPISPGKPTHELGYGIRISGARSSCLSADMTCRVDAAPSTQRKQYPDLEINADGNLDLPLACSTTSEF